MDTIESLRKRAQKYYDQAEDLRSDAAAAENTAASLDIEADLMEARRQKDLAGRAMDTRSICRRLLEGYLSGSALELVQQVLDEGHELPGFRDVCSTYGEVLP